MDPTDFNDKLWALQQSGRFTDAILCTEDGGRFPVHRMILAARNPYFRALFNAHMGCSPATKVNTIPGVSEWNLGAILRFLYTGQVLFSQDTVCELLIAADQFIVSDLVHVCADFLVRHLSVSNCINLYQLGQSYFCETLARQAYAFVMFHFPEVAEQNQDLLRLSVDDLSTLVASDEINVPSESVVWELVIRWIEFDSSERRDHITHLMHHIRLARLGEEFLMETVMAHPLVRRNASCRNVLSDAIKLLYDLRGLDPAQEDVSLEMARPRLPHHILFAIGGWSVTTPTAAVETYDIRADRWLEIPSVDPAGPRAYHGCAVIGFTIYVVGGFDGVEYFNTFRSFDAVTLEWQELSPLSVERCYVSVVALDRLIYAMGGFDGAHRLNTVERYNPRTNQWSGVTSMNGIRSDANSTTMDGKIYIVGGFNGLECVRTAEAYDPVTDTWSLIAPMACKRSGVACISHCGSVYAIGGFNGIVRLRSAERYSPFTKKWSRIADMHICRSNFAVQVLEDFIFVFGGYNGIRTIPNVEYYNSLSESWKETSDMNVSRSALTSCVISCLPSVKNYVSTERDNLDSYKRWRFPPMRMTSILPTHFYPDYFM